MEVQFKRSYVSVCFSLVMFLIVNEFVFQNVVQQCIRDILWGECEKCLVFFQRLEYVFEIVYFFYQVLIRIFVENLVGFLVENKCSFIFVGFVLQGV